MSEPAAPSTAGIAPPNSTKEHPPFPAPIETATPATTTAETTEAGLTAAAAEEAAAPPAETEPAREEATTISLVKTSESATEAPPPLPVVNQTVPTAPPVPITPTAPAPSTAGTTSTSPTAPITPEVPGTIVEKASTPPVIHSGPTWPALDKDHPLTQFQSRLPKILAASGHSLIWGITLSAKEPIPFHTTLVLQKFLRANSNNVDAAYNQLLATLKWRKGFNTEAVCNEEFSERKFSGLGYVMKTKTKDGEKIITYNIYGSCKDPKRTFGDLDR